jgi:hypothetical protein
MSTNSNSIPIMIEPRFAGLKNPTAAKTMRKNAQKTSCMPVPTMTQKNMGMSVGGRKTSACTSFHPVSSRSSCFSSSVSTCAAVQVVGEWVSTGRRGEKGPVCVCQCQVTDLVVLGDVAVEGPQQDDGHHEGQEHHDEHRVDDGEPVDLF